MKKVLSSQSKASLLKSILLSMVVAATILITAILPAEFGIDYTGIGTMLGLDALSIPIERPVVVSRSGEGEFCLLYTSPSPRDRG